jgi:hypothetical protein
MLFFNGHTRTCAPPIVIAQLQCIAISDTSMEQAPVRLQVHGVSLTRSTACVPPNTQHRLPCCYGVYALDFSHWQNSGTNSGRSPVNVGTVHLQCPGSTSRRSTGGASAQSVLPSSSPGDSSVVIAASATGSAMSYIGGGGARTVPTVTRDYHNIAGRHGAGRAIVATKTI